jgi:hypothetical protein
MRDYGLLFAELFELALGHDVVSGWIQEDSSCDAGPNKP